MTTIKPSELLKNYKKNYKKNILLDGLLLLAPFLLIAGCLLDAIRTTRTGVVVALTVSVRRPGRASP